MTSPPTKQKNIRQLIIHPVTLSLTLSLKTVSQKPSGNLGLLSSSGLDSLLGAYNERRTFLHHNPVSDQLCCVRASGPKCGSVTLRPRLRRGRGVRESLGGKSIFYLRTEGLLWTSQGQRRGHGKACSRKKERHWKHVLKRNGKRTDFSCFV